jgi:type I restriction enzyme R subunit
VTETAAANEKLREAAKANTLENFAFVFDKMLESLFIERMEGNEDIFNRLMNDDSFRNLAAGHLVREVYERIRDKSDE